MTHTLHRRGEVADLHEDYVMLIRTARGFNDQGSEEKMQGIWEVISHYKENLINFGNHNPNWEGEELYDLEADRTEMTDLSAVQMEKVAELLQRYERWARRSNVASWKSWESW